MSMFPSPFDQTPAERGVRLMSALERGAETVGDSMGRWVRDAMRVAVWVFVLFFLAPMFIVLFVR